VQQNGRIAGDLPLCIWGEEGIVKKLGAAVLLWACGIVLFMLGFLVVIYIHENWPSLEAPAVFSLLALGIALRVIALRARFSG
jgi:hypothetical protein